MCNYISENKIISLLREADLPLSEDILAGLQFPSKELHLVTLDHYYLTSDVQRLLKVAFDCNILAKGFDPGHYREFQEYFYTESWVTKDEIRKVYLENKKQRDLFYFIKALAIRLAIKSLLRENEYHFKFGRNIDETTYEDVVFFELGANQVSFHHEIVEWIPHFKGIWTGKVNIEFPTFY